MSASACKVVIVDREIEICEIRSIPDHLIYLIGSKADLHQCNSAELPELSRQKIKVKRLRRTFMYLPSACNTIWSVCVLVCVTAFSHSFQMETKTNIKRNLQVWQKSEILQESSATRKIKQTQIS